LGDRRDGDDILPAARHGFGDQVEPIAPEYARGVTSCPHPLDGIEHVLLLRHDRASQLDCPWQAAVHPLNERGKLRERLDAGLPGLRAKVHCHVCLRELERRVANFKRID
jgi:hypothetical protein